MSSGDFWCEEHSGWNCMCHLPPGSITTSGGGMAQKRTETALHLGEDNYVTREDSTVTIRQKGGRPVVHMDYETWKKIGGKEFR